MTKHSIKHFIDAKTNGASMVETGLDGVQFFRVSDPIHCAPVVYDPCIVAIVNGRKEVILDGTRYMYDSHQYMCCPMSMPVAAETPGVTPDNPLLGVVIMLDTRVMRELTIDMETATGTIHTPKGATHPQGIALADWDDRFTDALWRLVQLVDNPADMAVLGQARLRELYYAVLKGDADASARRAFGVGNEIARAIEMLSSRINDPITIEDMAAQVGMSRAAFHRKFKQATTMSPIQFVKSMRLNNAAMKIASGMNVNAAAMDVGYVSASQFSREFKRMYGQSPKEWGYSNQNDARKAAQF